MSRQVPVSVVIPVLNGSALLGASLRSIDRQSWRPQEIIVVDGGSQDNSEAVTRQFENAVFHIHSEPNAAEKRNVGARLATMPHIAFLDADDLWPALRIEKQLQRLFDNSELELVTGSMQQFRVGPSGEIVPLSGPEPSHLPSVALMRRDTFWKVGPFSPQWKVGETIEWWSRAIDAGVRSEAIPDVVLLRRVHEGNLGKTAESPNRAYLKMLHAIVNRRRAKGLL